MPQLRRVGDAWYVNPGSVGLGYDHRQPDDDFRFDPWASYAIVSARSPSSSTASRSTSTSSIAVTRAARMPHAGEVFDRYRRS